MKEYINMPINEYFTVDSGIQRMLLNYNIIFMHVGLRTKFESHFANVVLQHYKMLCHTAHAHAQSHISALAKCSGLK